MARTYFVSVRIDEEIRQEIEELAIRMDRPLSWICRDALVDWLKKKSHPKRKKRS